MKRILWNFMRILMSIWEIFVQYFFGIRRVVVHDHFKDNFKTNYLIFKPNYFIFLKNNCFSCLLTFLIIISQFF